MSENFLYECEQKEQLLTRMRYIGRLTTCCDNSRAFICDLDRLINVSGCVLIMKQLTQHKRKTTQHKFAIFSQGFSRHSIDESKNKSTIIFHLQQRVTRKETTNKELHQHVEVHRTNRQFISALWWITTNHMPMMPRAHHIRERWEWWEKQS